MSTIEAPPDLAEVTARQRQVWSTGDYTVIATLVHPVSETLVDAADLHAGWRVLDVACGPGFVALEFARQVAQGLVAAKIHAGLEQAGFLLPQRELSPRRLAEFLRGCSRERLLAMAKAARRVARADATERVAEACIAEARKR